MCTRRKRKSGSCWRSVLPIKPTYKHQPKIGRKMEHLKALGKASQQPQRPKMPGGASAKSSPRHQLCCALYTAWLPHYAPLLPSQISHILLLTMSQPMDGRIQIAKIILNSFRNHQSFHEACTLALTNSLLICWPTLVAHRRLLTPAWRDAD